MTNDEPKPGPTFLSYGSFVFRVDEILYWFQERETFHPYPHKRWVITLKTGQQLFLRDEKAGPGLLKMLQVCCPVLIADADVPK